MNAAIIGRKLGMTSLYSDDGRHIPCTVVEAGPCPVVLRRTMEKDGYAAIQIGFEEISEKKITKPRKGAFDKAGVKPTRILKEFRDPKKEYEIGQKLTVEQFAIGDLVHVSGNSKGKGFQGVMKRYNFSGVGMASHGQKDRQRHPGSVGQSSSPSRIMKGIKMAGRMGGKRVTVRNIQIVDIIPDRNLLVLKGCIPGPPNTQVEIVNN